MERRAAERTRRPEAVSKARAMCELTRKVVDAWALSKPHINETEKAGLLEKARIRAPCRWRPQKGESASAWLRRGWLRTCADLSG